MSRTRWAELYVEGFVSPAFVSEFVFRSPKVRDRGIQREVADLLITRAEQAILVSQKSQDNPSARRQDKLRSWAQKQSTRAVSQIKGALRRVGAGDEVWCDHPRRGKVVFARGLPVISHGVAAVEVFERVELERDVPLEIKGTPVSYFSVSDFLNLAQQLRTVPELIRYLDERRSLPEAELRIIGAERVIFEYYLLSDGSLSGFTTRSDIEQMLAVYDNELSDAIRAKAANDGFSHLLEHVADQLAARHSNYRDGLSASVLDNYEPDTERRAYLEMQEAIAGMHLAERSELGRVFDGAIRQRQAGGGFAFAAALVPSQPDLVFVLGSFGESSTFSRDQLLSAFHRLSNDAMAQYGCDRCLIIVDRDGVSYEAGLAQRVASPSLEQVEMRSKVFGALRLSAREVHFRPTGPTKGTESDHA